MNDLFSRIVRATVGGTVVFLAIIFIPAGTVDYWQGWAFAGTLMVLLLLVTIYMALNDRELLEELAAHGSQPKRRLRRRSSPLSASWSSLAAIFRPS